MRSNESTLWIETTISSTLSVDTFFVFFYRLQCYDDKLAITCDDVTTNRAYYIGIRIFDNNINKVVARVLIKIIDSRFIVTSGEVLFVSTTMKLFALVFVLQYAYSYGLQPRIANGVPSNPKDFPFYVYLDVIATHKCGGSLISDRYQRYCCQLVIFETNSSDLLSLIP